MQTDVWAFGYGFTVALGGVIGFVKAGSVVSLMAGLIFGALALIGAYQTSQDPHNYYLSLAVSGILAGLMGYRFAKSSKIMPAGLVAILSIAMCCRILCRAFSPTISASSTASASPAAGKQ
uniref:Putative membrane protein n=1 Tax=Amblyomma aureolatum TaxID=187763 RepID=A0A1E1WZ68_9ACAR